MTEAANVLLRVRQLLSAELDDTDIEAIHVAAMLRADLGLTGTQIVSIGYGLQSEFSIELTTADEHAMDAPRATVGDVLAVVQRHLAAKGPSA